MTEGTGPIILSTPRLRVVSATPVLVDAELDGHHRLAALLGAVIPSDWPPEHHDTETLRFWREELSKVGADGWWLYYIVVAASVRPTLVGTVSYKGPPNEGVVEIGYSVVSSWQRRGVATEASRALIEAASQRGAKVVLAHTFEHLKPSIGVLRKLGFQPTESSEPDALEFILRLS